MMTLDQVRQQLADRNAEAVARATGIHPNTVRAIKKGKAVVRSDTLEQLSNYLESSAHE